MSEKQSEINYNTENRKMKAITYIDYTTGAFTDLPYNATPYDEKVIGMTSKFKEKNPEPFFLVPCIRFQKNLKDILQLNHNEIGMLFYLMSYANYRSLHYTEKEEVCYFSYCNNNTYFKGNKDLEKILQVSNNIVKKFKKKLKDNGILHEDERGFYIKKEYLIRGKAYTLEKKSRFYKISNNYVKKLVVELRNNNVKKYYSALGFLFSLLSFINIHEKDPEGNSISPSFNRLVNQEYSFENNRFLSIPKEELVKKMGISKSTLTNKTRELNTAMKAAFNEYLILEGSINPVGYENEKVVSWFINPHFSYSNDRKTEEYKNLVELSKIKKENADERN
ncbi:hypothetical protein H0243_02220 [Staphylococcus sciuri]|uniref:hypothetical protein n=1 Tax=Mammaliicoccus sciuri TaxID=1296 RepID=UPI0018CA07CC|nr:hypothetical protein [Mammaliicoccus sciuri]MBG9204589.1 hypothetical protein [Mammaliicoccus sciuri]MEB7394284.1 hypothetical protein [Mammaliicoccus sciuri]MEB8142365.1 hypothetical protein [Mammaliicoccus sciuri]